MGSRRGAFNSAKRKKELDRQKKQEEKRQRRISKKEDELADPEQLPEDVDGENLENPELPDLLKMPE